MFTGLIEEIGIIENIYKTGEASEIIIACSKILEDIAIDDSISVNGVCLTVEQFQDNTFKVTAVEETLRKTNLNNLVKSAEVNLERAVKADTRLGGHYVQGHTDTTVKLLDIKPEEKDRLFTFEIPSESRKYLIEHGSVTINGISLTIASIDDDSFTTAIIPHTFKNTTFKSLKTGDMSNIEFDIIGRYVENMVKFKD